MKTVEDWKKELLAQNDVEKLLAVNTTEDVEGNFRRFLALYAVKQVNPTDPTFAVAETEIIKFNVSSPERVGFVNKGLANNYFWERTIAKF